MSRKTTACISMSHKAKRALELMAAAEDKAQAKIIEDMIIARARSKGYTDAQLMEEKAQGS